MMRVILMLAMVGWAGVGWGAWSNTPPAAGEAPITGPGVVAWRAHMAAQGTNAHTGLIATNMLDPVTLAMQNGLLTVLPNTGKVDYADATYTATVAMAASALQDASAFDAAGSAAAVSNWAAGRFDAAVDHAALTNLGWTASGHTNAPCTFAYFGADNAAYGLTWLEVISDLGPYFDEEGSAAAVSNAAWAQSRRATSAELTPSRYCLTQSR